MDFPMGFDARSQQGDNQVQNNYQTGLQLYLADEMSSNCYC